MSLASFDQLYQEADARRPAVPLVAVGAADRTVLEAMRQACDRGWAEPQLAGREADIRRTAEACGVDLHGLTILDPDEPAAAAVAQVRNGRARLLMKGQIATP